MLAPGSASALKPPKIHHVFTIVLENEDAAKTFGRNSPAPYLAKKLTRKGEYLPNYYGTGHLSLDNYISMVSGQAPNPVTQADCPVYSNFTGTATSSGQYVGLGCIYPPGAETIANQLEDKGYTWHEYAQDMNAAAPKGKEEPCRHPAIGSLDDTQSAEKGDQYATRHNPFMYFHSIIDFPTCQRNVVDLKHLHKDLRRRRTTPNYSFITPNLCKDGHDEPCVNGKPGGLVSADRFLKRKVPLIMRSSAYRHHGLIIIIFDEAIATGDGADSTACCNEPAGPNTPSPGGPHPGPGGGKVGAVLLSPCIKPGTVNKTPYNHYSMLRSIEDNFGLPHLGYAGQRGLEPFGRKTLNRRHCGHPRHH
jgi:hypothetical protein